MLLHLGHRGRRKNNGVPFYFVGKHMAKKNQPKTKHIPERKCIACRITHPKSDMVRIVRSEEVDVIIDETGKKNGRGAYLCRQQSCWEHALKRGELNRALRLNLSPKQKHTLETYAASLPKTLALEDQPEED